VAPHFRTSGRARNTKSSRTSYRKVLWFRPQLERLGDRTLLSAPEASPSAVLGAYQGSNNGISVLAGQSTSIVNQALGGLQILDGISQYIQTPFQTPLTANQLTGSSPLPAGFSLIEKADIDPTTGNWIPYTDGNYFEVNYTQTWNNPQILVTGPSGFSYLDGSDGGGSLIGGINTTGTLTFTATMGVDNAGNNNTPAFFILPSNSSNPTITANLSAATSNNALTGTLNISGGLANVNASAGITLNLSATGNFQPTSSDTDGKIRLTDFQNALSSVVTGTFGSGNSASLMASFDTHLLGVDVPWTGSFNYSLSDNNTKWTTSYSLDQSTFSTIAQNLLSNLSGSLSSFLGNINILGPLSSELNKPIPIIDQSIAQLTGLDKYLPQFPSLPSSLTNGSIPLGGGTLTVNIKPATIGELLNGENVDLLSWTTGPQSDSIASYSYTIPVFSLGIFTLEATVNVNASLNYDLGFGIDNHGFYFDAGPSNPLFGLTFGVSGGVEGELGIPGFLSVGVGGNVGFSVTPYVYLAAPTWGSNVYGTTSKVYLNGELNLFGPNPISDILDDFAAGIRGDLTASAYASVHLLFFHHTWTVGTHIPVFNFTTAPTWPPQPGGGAGSFLTSTQTPNGIILTYEDTRSGNAGDVIKLSEPSTGQVAVKWDGGGAIFGSAQHPVVQFNFIGSNTTTGSNRLTTSPGFNIPIFVNDSGSGGNDFFEGGAANDTIVGGSGKDTLVAGSGNDSITAGSGDTMILGGSGNDTLVAGSGTDTVYGGSGNSTLQGWTGNASLYAGSGNDSIVGSSGTYFIDGGNGSDTINAGSGLNDSIYGGSGGNNLITGSSAGHDLIYGGGPGDTIYGGAGGYDTIYGGSGSDAASNTNNQIYGGAGGNNSIYGGGGGDTLYAGTGGNNTIYGSTGAETLYGGDGQDLVVNATNNGLIDAGGDNLSPGNNLLVGGSGNDVIYGDSNYEGHNTLQAGSGNDTLYAGNGGDVLEAGPGTDALYGGPGNDTLVLSYLPISSGGQAQGQDTLDGGPGTNTLVIRPSQSVANPGPGILAAPITDTTSTTITVTDGANITSAELAQPGGYVIQIDNEQMLVTAVSGNTLTVVRGYNGTTAATHDANALVLPESAPPPPPDYKVYLAPVVGTTGQYQATLSNLDSGAAIGQIVFSLPVETTNLELMGGSGNNWIQVDPAVTQDVILYGGPGNNTLIAGSGNDTLVAGSGTSVLYGGSGDDVLYGSDLPGQDDPSAALASGGGIVTPTSGAIQEIGTVSNGSSTITGLDTSQLQVGQLVVGGGIPNGTIIDKIDSPNTISLSNVASVINQSATAISEALFFAPPTLEGSDTLIAGSGNDELFAGSGNDVLIGGSVLRQSGPNGVPGLAQLSSNGNYILTEGAGRDMLQGGAGNDLMIAGPGSPGEMLFAGSGNDTLVAENGGDNVLRGGPGNDLLLGGNGNDVLISGSVAAGGNTLVGGLGLDTLLAAAGNDVLYAYPETASWEQAEQSALAVNVLLTAPGNAIAGETSLEQDIDNLLKSQQTQANGLDAADLQTLSDDLDTEFSLLGVADPTLGNQIANQLQPQNLSTLSATQLSALVSALDEAPVVHDELQNILVTIQDTQPQALPIPQQNLLQAILADEATQLFDQDSALEGQMAPLQGIPPSQRTTAQQMQLVFLTTEDNQILQERIRVQSELAGTLVDSLVGGSGNDQLYGRPNSPTYLAGGSGNNTFYNYHPGDTVQGGKGGTNTLMIQGDGTINLLPDSQNTNAIDVNIGSQPPLVVGNVGTISNIQVLGVLMGSGNDTVNIGTGSASTPFTLPAGLTGILVQAGSGNDLINAVSLTNAATLRGGSGNDKILIGYQLPDGRVYDGGTGQSELDIVGPGGSTSMTASVANGKLTVNGVPAPISNFSKVVIIGGGGTNTFTSDGTTISNTNGNATTVVMEGGSGGQNQFTAKDGTVDMVGGSGPNTTNEFILDVPSAFPEFTNYTVTGGTGTNTLQILCDNNGDTVNLSQQDSPSSIITVSGHSSTGGFIGAQATNMDSVSVVGGSGNDKLDASGMLMGVTLDGGGGNDTLIGGQGNDDFIYRDGDTSYDGGGGTDNRLIYQDTNGDPITAYPGSFFDNSTGIYHMIISLQNIEYYEIDGNPSSVSRGDDTFLASDWLESSDNIMQGWGTSGSESQALSGGNPGSYMAGTSTTTFQPVFLEPPPPPYPSWSWSTLPDYFLYLNYGYNPASQGAINGLTVQLDQRLFSASGTSSGYTLPGIGVFLVQGGGFYTSTAFAQFSNPGAGWSHESSSVLTSSDFQNRFQGPGINVHPDFSS
jgi:Ca2+-binding RTX toxin-like protein